MWTSTQLDSWFSAQFVTTCSCIFHEWNFIHNGRFPANLSEISSRCYILVLCEAELTAICAKNFCNGFHVQVGPEKVLFSYFSDPRIFCRNFQAASAGSITCQVNRLDFMSTFWWLCTSWAPKSCQKRMSFHSRKYPSIVTNRVSPNVCLQRGRWGGSNKVGPHCSNKRENVFSWLSVSSLNHALLDPVDFVCR